MAAEVQAVLTGIEEGQTLAVADRILTHPEPGRLLARLDALIVDVTESGARQELISQTLVRLAMNFAGRDAEIVGYSAQECQAAFDHVLKVAAQLKGLAQTALRDVVRGFLSDMKSVNRADSLPGLLAERIESSLN